MNPSKDDYNLELLLLKIFFNYKKQDTISGPLTNDLLPLWWFVSIQLEGEERNLFGKPSNYEKYRFRLFRSLLLNIKTPGLITRLIQNDNTIRENGKKNLLREVVKKNWKNHEFMSDHHLKDFVSE